MKKKNFPVTNIGTISLMMIFIVLCMVTFAALSLSSAAGDARFGQKMSEHMTDYYTASNQAEELLAQADAVFAEAYQTAADADDYYERVSQTLSDTMDIQLEEASLYASYQVDINDTQALFVEISVLPPSQIKEDETGSFYQIRTWQVIHTETWEGDNTLNLM